MSEMSEFTKVDKIRLIHLERIEKYAEKLHELWVRDSDEVELERVMLKFMDYMTMTSDEE